MTVPAQMSLEEAYSVTVNQLGPFCLPARGVRSVVSLRSEIPGVLGVGPALVVFINPERKVIRNIVLRLFMIG